MAVAYVFGPPCRPELNCRPPKVPPERPPPCPYPLCPLLALTFPRTSSFAVEFLGVFDGASRLLFALLRLATLVKVFDNYSDEHVEHKEADEQQERDEVQQTPLVVVPLRLDRHTIDAKKTLFMFFYFCHVFLTF